MEADRSCPQCGRSIPARSAECPYCAHPVLFGSESILFVSLLVLAALFVFTGFVAGAYHSSNAALGREWYGRGQADLKGGKAETAIVDFRTALIYDRDNQADQLSLAMALSAANRPEEARAYLTSLWEHDPENAVVNLELGRLATVAGNTNDALRYYHNAMYADWGTENPGEQRRKARLELFNFLMKHGDRTQAEAELVEMAALLPPDAKLYTLVGQLFTEVGDDARAATEFTEALKLDRNAGEATLAGAGEAEFNLGNYGTARLYLERALRKKPSDAKLRSMLEQANLVVSADPYQPGLSEAERDRRVISAFRQALRRLTACGMNLSAAPAAQAAPGANEGGKAASATPAAPAPSGTGLDALAARARTLEAQVNVKGLRQNPDLADEVMGLVDQVEVAGRSCGAPEPLDQALLALAGRRPNS